MVVKDKSDFIKKRLNSLDAARGFTVLMMPAVHAVMLYSKPGVQQGWLGVGMAFIAEGPGAQLFMFIMGFGIAAGRRKTVQEIFKRGLLLLAAGYVLNYLRLVLPAGAGALPGTLTKDYIAYTGYPVWLNLMLTGDILQFAGIAYMLTGWLHHLKQSHIIALIIIPAIIFIAPLAWGIRGTGLISDHLLALVCADDHRAFFPLLPWLAYPLAGSVVAHYYLKNGENKFFRGCLCVGILLMITGSILNEILPFRDKDFYRSAPGRTFMQTGFVLCWIWLIQLLIIRFSKNLFFKLLMHCSRNITIIYFLQWIILAWGCGIMGVQQLTLVPSLFISLAAIALTLGIMHLLLILAPLTLRGRVKAA
jgi:uncharacterized membrane protein